MSEQAQAGTISTCPKCGAGIEESDQFCEVCGRPLGPGAETAGAEPAAGGDGGGSVAEDRSLPTAPAATNPCVGCGAPAGDILADGYCSICGRLQPGPRDHVEVDLVWAAGVTDRGRFHPRNQDAFHLQLAGPVADNGVVAVVCDGVSSSVRAEDAAETAAAAAGAVLASVAAGPGSLADATVHAADAATRAVVALAWTPTGQLASPACTLVSAVCRAGEIAVGWVGDSRGYWIGDEQEGVRQLTVDHSWAEDQVETGRMTEAEAGADPRSHAITRWIGADAPSLDAPVVTMSTKAGVRLLLCSDGLWNYAPTIEDMAHLLAGQPAQATPIELARSLTEFARTAGGHDNITVVVIDLPAPPAGEKGTP